MTPGGPCFECREFTGRYDKERKRWACRACWPEPLDWEAALAASFPSPEFPNLDPVLERLPGESRQAWRRRCREAGRAGGAS